jgi:hypothetical protein
MTFYILLGANGRLGRICRKLLINAGQSFATVDRTGNINYGSRIIGNIYRKEFHASYKYFVIDASIDYTSIEKLNEFEQIKKIFFSTLNVNNLLLGIVAFSSGVVDFADDLISDPFYQNYKNQKIKLEEFLSELASPFLCLRIYTLIGSESYKTKGTGWVSVLEAALEANQVEISDPLEPRSWVSEESVADHISKFISRPFGKIIMTPISGAFTLFEVVNIASGIKNQSVAITKGGKGKWLTVPYVCDDKSFFKELNLDNYLKNLVNHRSDDI